MSPPELLKRHQISPRRPTQSQEGPGGAQDGECQLAFRTLRLHTAPEAATGLPMGRPGAPTSSQKAHR
eukprot:2241561-Pyramimonas_sp.AAC.1